MQTPIRLFSNFCIELRTARYILYCRGSFDIEKREKQTAEKKMTISKMNNSLKTLRNSRHIKYILQHVKYKHFFLLLFFFFNRTQCTVVTCKILYIILFIIKCVGVFFFFIIFLLSFTVFFYM